MAIAGTLAIIPTDFSNALGGIVSACSPNVLIVEATLSGGTDANAYCIVELFVFGEIYNFRMVNKDFNGTDGEFYFDFTDILPYIFPDISDDELTTGVQTVVDTFFKMPRPDLNLLEVNLFDSSNNLLDNLIYPDGSILFSSKQIGNTNGSNEVDIFNHKMPNFLAQKNKQSYIYYYGNGNITFSKVDYIPEDYILLDNSDAGLVDNADNFLILNF